MTREPVAIVTLACAVAIVLFGMFQGMDAGEIAAFVAIIGGGGFVARSQVTPVADPVDKDGTQLVSNGLRAK